MKTVTVHHKWEGCWCGAHVSAEGSEQEVQEVCRDFRARHRHTERETMGFDPRQRKADELGIGAKAMPPRQLGTMKVNIFAGEPSRTDKNYAVLVEDNGLCVFDGWRQFEKFDNNKPTIFDDPDAAEKARDSTASLYERMGIERKVIVVEREVLTFITEWKYPGDGPVDLTP